VKAHNVRILEQVEGPKDGKNKNVNEMKSTQKKKYENKNKNKQDMYEVIFVVSDCSHLVGYSVV
jgi:hypothetical protein